MPDYRLNKINPMYISKRTYLLLFFLLGIVYFLGFLFPIMDLDATEYAMVAYRMAANHDYIHIFSRSAITGKVYDYLDKPHLSFWLEAISFKIFGYRDWAYRLPSVLFTILGAFSTFRLGRKIYSLETGYLSTLFFLGAQAIILENHDVRTDALLGGAVIFSIAWLYEFVQERKGYQLFLGILGVVLGVATKGMIAVVVVGTAMFFFLLYAKEWKRLLDYRWLLAIPLFFILLSPVLYAYYLQFDLHPEKLVKGAYHVSGIKFLLWSQSFERYAGIGEFVQYPEFSFFFHTYLWAFLPWSLLSYFSVFYRSWTFIKLKFQKIKNMEFMTLGTSVSLFLLLSGMQYKMPHYINVLFPLFSILLASVMLSLAKDKIIDWLVYIQAFVFVILFIAVVLLNTFCFPLHSLGLGIIFILLVFLGIYYLWKGNNKIVQLILPSALMGIAVNILLNGNLYPQLMHYQSGSELGKYIEEKKIDPKDVYYYGSFSRSFDFYTAQTGTILDSTQLLNQYKSHHPFYIYTNENQLNELKKLNLNFFIVKRAKYFRVTKITLQFLNPSTRAATLGENDLIQIN